MQLSSVDISGVGKYKELWQCGDSWHDRAGYEFSFGADLTMALWLSGRPRQNPQSWLVILLGLPLCIVRMGAENRDNPHTLCSELVTGEEHHLHIKRQHVAFQIQAQPSHPLSLKE